MHATRMRGEERGQICEVERVHATRIRGEERGQICEVERVNARRMREEQGRTDVCGREGACEKDGED